MDKKRYYPAIFVGKFKSGHTALASLGIVGDDADFCLIGVEVNRDRPVVFEIFLKDLGAKLSDESTSKSAVVLMERKDGSIGLWFGMFNYLSDTFDGAQLAAIDELLSDENDEPPTLDVFEWAPPARILQ